MFNLRFKCTVISSWHMVLHAVPKANKMIANKSRYSEKERFEYAKWIINYMRKHARTRTKVYGRENIPTDSNYIMYSNHQGKYDALGIILAQEKPCGVLWGKKHYVIAVSQCSEDVWREKLNEELRIAAFRWLSFRAFPAVCAAASW